jgi:hypothetical protein
MNNSINENVDISESLYMSINSKSVIWKYNDKIKIHEFIRLHETFQRNDLGKLCEYKTLFGNIKIDVNKIVI